MNNRTKLIIKDDTLESLLHDEFVTHHDRSTLKGIVVIKDPEGKVLFRKKNLVVLRGRVFALEKVFNFPIDPELASFQEVPNYKENLNRQICLFGIGTGGASGNTVFEPITTDAHNEELYDPAPFRTFSTGGIDGLSEYEISNSIYTREVLDEDLNLTHYYLKRINTNNGFVPEWNFDYVTNMSSIKNTLEIESHDFVDRVINEFGLYIAELDTGVFSDIELFSHVTIPSQPLQMLNNFIIEYYLFS
jgi:hypothetical protein